MHRVLLVAALTACSGGTNGFGPIDLPDGKPPSLLSELQLVRMDQGELVYNDRVEPYTMNMPLFSDYAAKDRAIYVPEGQSAVWDDRWAFDLPVGGAMIKTFSFAPDLREPTVGKVPAETRVLIRTNGGWEAWPYVWNDDGLDATLAVSGTTLDVELIDRAGQELAFTYLVPQRNQCVDCHEIEDETGEKYIVPIGPSSRNIDDGTQLEHLADVGLLPAIPSERARPAADWATYLETGLDGLSHAEIDVIARDYLDVNCAHCHNDRAVNGKTSQLFLTWDTEDLFRLGQCKKPGSAAKGTGGRSYDIVPGDSDASILYYRLQTDDVGSMMPDIGRSVIHTEGIELLKAWIDGMEPVDCEG
jgi:uncharacterized repeat protein (TIGR03806 family)